MQQMKGNDVRKSLESIRDFAQAICQLNDWIKEWIMNWNCAYQAEAYTADAIDRYDWGFVDTYTVNQYLGRTFYECADNNTAWTKKLNSSSSYKYLFERFRGRRWKEKGCIKTNRKDGTRLSTFAWRCLFCNN